VHGALLCGRHFSASTSLRTQRPAPHQVAAGAFASKDRDAALNRMIGQAASVYSREQEQAERQQAALQQADSGDGVEASSLRKISLTSVRAVFGHLCAVCVAVSAAALRCCALVLTGLRRTMC
jgi:hypothetical protein